MLKIIYKPTGKLIPYAKNSRTHSESQIKQIAASIKEFGFTNPVLIDENDGIIAGHGRVMAAELLEQAKVPCIVLAGLTDIQKQAYVIADNKLALNAGWDLEMLSLELQELQESEYDLSMTGFSDDELEKLLSMGGGTEGLTDPDAVPEIPEAPVTEKEDVWLLGDHRLLCGDATMADYVDKLMNGDLADQFLTDPPYNIDYTGKTKKALKIKNDEMEGESFREFLSMAFSNADMHMKPGAVFYIWHAGSEVYSFGQACHNVGWKIRQCLIWNKNTMVMGRQDYQWKHEPCLYGWKEGAAHLWAADRKQVTVLEFDRPTKNTDHPTMKPVNLIEYQILNNTKGKDIILDLFGGSGSTLIAREKNGRFARIMELDPRYCDVIIKRWQDFTGKEAILESTNETFSEVSNGR